MRLTHTITVGHLARHVPPASNLGRDYALLDIAQDFLLAEFHRAGLFDGPCVFKGGTALRKHFSGPAGRFSLDLDLAVGHVGADPHGIANRVSEVVAAADHQGFGYRSEMRRGRLSIHVDADLGHVPQPVKVDVSPPPWLAPDVRRFVAAPVHARYDFALPSLPVVRFEEVLAEKIARLARTSTARDAADLVWAATTSPHSQMDRELVRRMAVLKVWVDNHGMDGHWHQAPGAAPFEPDVWLQAARDWDDENIGLLAHPPPKLAHLEHDRAAHYGWLDELDADERRWARCDPRDRADVVNAIVTLPGSHLEADSIWSTY